MLILCLFIYLFISAREIADADVQDHIPLIVQRKSHTWYTAEQGLEEVEEGAPATCFPCRGCVIL